MSLRNFSNVKATFNLIKGCCITAEGSLFSVKFFDSQLTYFHIFPETVLSQLKMIVSTVSEGIMLRDYCMRAAYK